MCPRVWGGSWVLWRDLRRIDPAWREHPRTGLMHLAAESVRHPLGSNYVTACGLRWKEDSADPERG